MGSRDWHQTNKIQEQVGVGVVYHFCLNFLEDYSKTISLVNAGVKLPFHITKITRNKQCELVLVSNKVQTSIINLA